MGPLEVTQETHQELVAHVESDGPISSVGDDDNPAFSQRVGETLALIAATREYQFG